MSIDLKTTVKGGTLKWITIIEWNNMKTHSNKTILKRPKCKSNSYRAKIHFTTLLTEKDRLGGKVALYKSLL